MLLIPADEPTAVLLLVVFAPKAPFPTAVLSVPLTHASSDNLPTAVFSEPVVFTCKALKPTAVLLEAVVLALKA